MSSGSNTEHLIWRIVGVPLGAAFVMACSGALDLGAGRPFGSTIRENLADPDPIYAIFAVVGILIWLAAIIAAFRARNAKSQQ